MVAALNPCPCGQFGVEGGRCFCSQADIARYLRRISGPLLDRIDLQVEVAPLSFDEISMPPAEPSRAIRERVCAARERQVERFREPALSPTAPWGIVRSLNTAFCRPRQRNF